MIATPANRNATTGATIAGITTLVRIAVPLTPDPPTAASIAPTTPPINACDELDGSPRPQVIRFHAIAPISPAKAIVSVT